MNEFLSSNRNVTHSKYYRLIIIACLDTLFNLPVAITLLLMEITKGRAYGLDSPYISWNNVHDGEGGMFPGLSLSSILQVPVSQWSTEGLVMFIVKWNEWLYVLHAVMFFSVFGTTPEMQSYYRSAFWFIPERCGYRRQHVSAVETVSDVVFSPDPDEVDARPTTER